MASVPRAGTARAMTARASRSAGRPSPVLAETGWKTVRDTAYQVAVLPWGAVEAHNYHLPFGADHLMSEHLAAEAARLAWERGARVIVLPGIPFGVNTGQLDIKLTINMNPSTQGAVLADVIASLEGHGIPKLVVLNGHGGNDFRQLLRELQPRHPRVFAPLAHPLAKAWRQLLQQCVELWRGWCGRAGAAATSAVALLLAGPAQQGVEFLRHQFAMRVQFMQERAAVG